MPFIFFSGSKLASDAPTETKRFSLICRALGKAIATLRYGIVGCPAHPSRVLASVEGMAGLYELAPDAPVSHANVSFPLHYQDRERFAALASAGVFVGGGSGTLEEFKICQELEIKPLIPVAGAGGAGQHLAKQMIAYPDEFFRVEIEDEVKNGLVESEGSASDYQLAVEQVLKAHKLGPKRFYSPE